MYDLRTRLLSSNNFKATTASETQTRATPGGMAFIPQFHNPLIQELLCRNILLTRLLFHSMSSVYKELFQASHFDAETYLRWQMVQLET
jgi:hypothetical protein